MIFCYCLKFCETSMSDSIKTFITDAIEYITNAEICQIHKTAQTRTACRVVALHEDRWMQRASRSRFTASTQAGPGFAMLRRGKVYFYNQKQQLPQS